ncbi:MAG: HEAT repeat domain-containing protein [Candidatus Margulisbacteria bacterium]|nr:HEAT repeat domain-containing protein [Candidatus Margulisiibacteriota bacterium]MBU1022590.1 HEAT repeat domain-containing protein [Candidatus Margulisiibacteriota bacterium]MBU1728876.1 HEAT repeat domain-containing protein [Candidatus Margulisiibacteriota bacterium]MBU1955507.1 HEAT repeat domain-containing protein [Candidatus Margulisiibacteriota bacterium]
MSISGVRSTLDLVKLYSSRDTNRNGKLETDEISRREIKKYDINGDNCLSPWEAMEAANTIQASEIFTINDIDRSKFGASYIPLITLESDTQLYEITYQEGTDLWVNDKLEATQGTLKDDTNFDGTLYKGETEIVFHEDGTVFSGTLAAPATFTHQSGKEITFQANTKIRFTEDGSVYSGTLAAPVTFSEIYYRRTIRETTQATYAANTEIAFCDNGEVEHGTLAEDTSFPRKIYQGTYYRPTIHPLSGYEVDHENEDVTYKGGTEIRFGSGWIVTNGTLAEDTRMSNKGGTLSDLHFMAAPIITFKAGTEIEYTNDGFIKTGTTAKTFTEPRFGLKFPAGSTVTFIDNLPILHSVTTSEVMEFINPPVIPAGTQVDLRSNKVEINRPDTYEFSSLIPLLIELLETENDPDRKEDLVEWLAIAGGHREYIHQGPIDESAISTLTNVLLNDPYYKTYYFNEANPSTQYYSVRHKAAEVLGRLDDDRSVPALIEAAKTPNDPSLRNKAINALEEMNTPKAIPILRNRMLFDPVKSVRDTAREAFKKTKETWD